MNIEAKEDGLVATLKIGEMMKVSPIRRTRTGISTLAGTVAGILPIVALDDCRGKSRMKGRRKKKVLHPML